MSQSNAFYKFPYCNYPYTFSSKIRYYFGKILCCGISLSGANLYASMLWKHSLPSDKKISSKKISDLMELKKTSCNKRNWHLRGLFLNTLISMPGIYYIKYFIGIPKHHIWRIVGLSGLLAFNNLYGVLAHTYNIIRYNRQINVINHGVKIAQAVKAVDSDLKKIESNKTNNIDFNSIENMIYSQLEHKKKSWHLFNMGSTMEEKSYIILNEYYENMFFIFNIESTAKDFMFELQALTITEIDILAGNISRARELQNEFIRTRIRNTLAHNYYNSY